MLRFPAALLVLSLLLVACSPGQNTGSASETPSSATGGTAAGTTVPKTGVPSPTGDADPRDPSKEPASRKKTQPSPMPSGPADHNTMPLSVTLNRTCVQPGQEMQATAVTEPNSKLAFAASYSDNDIVPDFTYTPAESNPTGTFTWTWMIRPNIPPGDSLVTVVAAKDDRGASFEHPFRVAASC